MPWFLILRSTWRKRSISSCRVITSLFTTAMMASASCGRGAAEGCADAMAEGACALLPPGLLICAHAAGIAPIMAHVAIATSFPLRDGAEAVPAKFRIVSKIVMDPVFLQGLLGWLIS
jgi:hypothetical protein